MTEERYEEQAEKVGGGLLWASVVHVLHVLLCIYAVCCGVDDILLQLVCSTETTLARTTPTPQDKVRYEKEKEKVSKGG